MFTLRTLNLPALALGKILIIRLFFKTQAQGYIKEAKVRSLALFEGHLKAIFENNY